MQICGKLNHTQYISFLHIIMISVSGCFFPEAQPRHDTGPGAVEFPVDFSVSHTRRHLKQGVVEEGGGFPWTTRRGRHSRGFRKRSWKWEFSRFAMLIYASGASGKHWRASEKRTEWIVSVGFSTTSRIILKRVMMLTPPPPSTTPQIQKE